MLTLTDIASIRAEVQSWKQRDLTVGLVPTMGYLHEGHLSLIRLARANCDRLVVSIFVNPTQFNDQKDYSAYPRNPERDLAFLAEAGIDAVFLPERSEVYGPNFQSWLEVSDLAHPFEGRSRPGHFRGVATVVAALFNIVEPHLAVFGEKDFQQLRIIEQLVEDLKFNVQILRAPNLREKDGLAMSSRNVRLSPSGRVSAVSLSRGLFAAQELFQKGEIHSEKLIAGVRKEIKESAPVAIDYVSVVDEQTLLEITKVDRPARILIAAIIDGVRLIDNVGLGAGQR